MLPSVSGYGGNEATIDLGLSLGSWLQQEANAPQQALQKKASMVNLEVGIEEEAGKQSTRGSGFVKVNMDEIGIGRKICVMDYAGYAGLALELEKMFGTHSPSGLRLLDQDSSFSLVYKDRNTGDWMPISNFSWQYVFLPKSLVSTMVIVSSFWLSSLLSHKISSAIRNVYVRCCETGMLKLIQGSCSVKSPVHTLSLSRLKTANTLYTLATLYIYSDSFTRALITFSKFHWHGERNNRKRFHLNHGLELAFQPHLTYMRKKYVFPSLL
ncbi:uncharacterized protein LOC116263959 isoform X2 [Nymphaea colorata]|uniref:uncharacterized protein LOC116263959 isoform X2 n=1 Tax=Nymphaea colorata TaxID=210225 RepID=UPI00214F4E59|nr:uncharacterized protein LOC116263959 isoform X2 [Nymphaea colorata]